MLFLIETPMGLKKAAAAATARVILVAGQIACNLYAARAAAQARRRAPPATMTH